MRCPAVDDAAARALAAVVGEARARILLAVAEPRTTTDLATRLGIAPSTASEHLTALARTGLLVRTRSRRVVRYRLSDRGRRLIEALDEP